jgi:ABC-type Fe3+-hydroxamate transport system substrate-binding protein
MQRAVIYGIVAAIVVAAGVSVAFATMSMNGNNTATDTASSSDNVRMIKHAMGETEIAGIPKRIVVLEWVYAEDLLALGVQPVGVADIEGMKQWVNLKGISLSPDVEDVGTRQEPNLEKISSLDPDLIIAPSFRIEQTYESLNDIAPTLAFNPYPGEEEGIGQLDEMEQTFMTIADLVGRHDKGAEVLEDLENYYTQAADKIRSAGATEREFVMVQAFTTEDVPHLRIFTDNSMAAQIMNKLGLQNAWDVEYELYGFTETGIEPLAEVQNANFFYIVQDNDNPFANQWNTSVWHNLEFVKQERTYPLGGDTWLFGGPISAKVIVDKVVGTLAGENNMSESGNQTKTASHAMGNTQISGIPQRILAISPEFTEHLLTLGVQPSAIIDSSTLRLWYPP